MIKVGIIGCAGSVDIARSMIKYAHSENLNIEIVEITQEEADEDKKLVGMCGVMGAGKLSSDMLKAHEIKPIRFDNKTGSNKSDRKRDRANRWR